MPQRSRGWCFTSYSSEEDPPFWDEALQEPRCPESYEGVPPKELVFQREICPDTGREHWQGYVAWSAPISFGRVRSFFGDDNAHIEPRRGTPAQARAYASKRDSRKPSCEPVWYGCSPDVSQGHRTDLEEAYRYLRASADAPPHLSEYADRFPQVWCKYPRLFERVQALRPRTPVAELAARRCVFICGPTGTGKSYYARQQLEAIDPNYFDKSPGDNWFDGYAGQVCALFDDFRGNWLTLSTMLRVLDKYDVRLPVKGGHCTWKPSTIFVTSNHPIESLYTGDKVSRVDVEALLRRFEGNYFMKLSRDEPPVPYDSGQYSPGGPHFPPFP